MNERPCTNIMRIAMLITEFITILEETSIKKVTAIEVENVPYLTFNKCTFAKMFRSQF